MDNIDLRGLDSEQLKNLTLICYIPGAGVPSHEPMWFGHPFNISLKPATINEDGTVAESSRLHCEGSMAKALTCEFPHCIFLVGTDGKPRKLRKHQVEAFRAKPEDKKAEMADEKVLLDAEQLALALTEIEAEEKAAADEAQAQKKKAASLKENVSSAPPAGPHTVEGKGKKA